MRNPSAKVRLQRVRTQLDRLIKVINRILMIAHVLVHLPSSYKNQGILRIILQHSSIRANGILQLLILMIHQAKVISRPKVLGVNQQSLLKHSNRFKHILLRLLHPFKSQPFRMPKPRVIRLNLNRLVIVTMRFIKLTFLVVNIASVKVKNRVKRVQLNRSVQITHRFFIPLHLVIRKPTVVQKQTRIHTHSGVFLVQLEFEVLDCFLVLGDCILEHLFFEVAETEVVVSAGVVRFELDCLLELVDGLVDEADFSKADAFVVAGEVKDGVGWVLDCFVEVFDGFFKPVEFGFDLCSVVVVFSFEFV